MPMSQGHGPKRGNIDNMFHHGHHWICTHPRCLWLFSQWDPESSTQVMEEWQLVGEHTYPMSTSQGQVCHIT